MESIWIWVFVIPLGVLAGWWLGKRQQHVSSATPDPQQAANLQLAEARLADARRDLAAISQELGSLRDTHTQVSAEREGLRVQLAEAKTQLEEAKTHWKAEWDKDFQKFLNTTLEQSREALQRHATLNLEEKNQALDKTMQGLVTPIKEMLTAYEQKIQKLEATNLERHGALAQHLTELTRAKDDLVSVLKTNKGVGDWGELELMRLLDGAGLIRGIHYDYQATESEGKRPDLKIYLPTLEDGRQRFIYVDAKTLGVSYKDRLDGDGNELPLDVYTQKLHGSLKDAIKLLASKSYTSQIDGTPDFVILYVPRESMLSLVWELDSDLWHEAYEKGVVLTTPYNLIGLLRLIAHGWREVTLSQEARQIQQLGVSLHDKLVLFCERMESLGGRLESTQREYEAAMATFNGRGGLIGRAKKLAELGAGSARSLPTAMADNDLITEEQTLLLEERVEIETR